MRSNSDYLGLTVLVYTDCLFKPRAGNVTFLWLHMPDNKKFIFTGILLLEKSGPQIFQLVLITQDAILTVIESIVTLVHLLNNTRGCKHSSIYAFQSPNVFLLSLVFSVNNTKRLNLER